MAQQFDRSQDHRAVLHAQAGQRVAHFPFQVVGFRTRHNIAAAIERKVNIAAGTDAGISAHGENLTELSCLVELGMSPMDAIRAATSNSARLMGVDDRLGTLRPGMLADLVICKDTLPVVAQHTQEGRHD
ncbi:amidohydrolase family protein [Actinosynnema sp. CS-041913]|uniref:amidohydrolase family protein n=1 Tax=Actinosynnema sp. CS-041913 TaxID=3239917 RepID=UPI003D90E76C